MKKLRHLRIKHVLGILLCLLHISPALAKHTGLSTYRLEIEQKNFPADSLEDTEYVKRSIHYMHHIDQEMRKEFIKNTTNIEALKQMDQFHTGKMKEILAVHGWPRISEFGKETDREAWLLVQHSDDDPFFQAGCLFILSQLINNNETDKKNYAYLYDRVALHFQNLGMKQKYGTQISISENGEVTLRPHDGSLEDVDLQRKDMGLEPMKNYLDTIKQIYRKDH